MTPSSWAGVITAFATLLTAVGGLIVAVKVLIPQRRDTKEIHKIVNQQKTDMLRFQRSLIQALVAHGIPVPEDQSLPLPGEAREHG